MSQSAITPAIIAEIEPLYQETDPAVFLPLLLEHKNNEELVVYIVAQLGKAAFPYLDGLTESGAAWLLATEGDEDFFEHIPERLTTDKRFLVDAVGASGVYLKHVPQKWRDDKDIGLAYLAFLETIAFEPTEDNSGMTFDLSSNLCADKEFVREAIRVYPEITFYLGDNLRKDAEFVHELVQSEVNAAWGIAGEYLSQDALGVFRQRLSVEAEAQRLQREAPNGATVSKAQFKL